MLIKIPTNVMAKFKKVYEEKTGTELKKLLEYSEAVEDVLLSYLETNMVGQPVVEQKEERSEEIDTVIEEIPYDLGEEKVIAVEKIVITAT